MRHVPVLPREVIDALQLKPNANVIDGTLGDAGHSELILDATGPNGRVLGIDADPESLLRAKQHLYRFGERVICIRDNFANVSAIVQKEQFGSINGILLDLGWSSPQFDERGRGFSFEKDEPLDMRFNPTAGAMTAEQVVNAYSESELARIFKMFGEEKLYREIAAAIVMARKNAPISRTGQLVEIVLDVYRTKLKSTKDIPWIGGLHPATKVFQALRIEANHELEVLKKVLPEAATLLSPGGRLVVISFHSLEDRIVKQGFKAIEIKKFGRIVTKKPVVASEAEVAVNPRARSAKLRVFEKI